MFYFWCTFLWLRLVGGSRWYACTCATYANVDSLRTRTRYSKYVRCISIYWCKAKHFGHLATVSDYFIFNQFNYYYKLLYLKLNVYISFWRYYWKFAVDVLSLLSWGVVLNHAYNFFHLTSGHHLFTTSVLPFCDQDKILKFCFNLL